MVEIVGGVVVGEVVGFWVVVGMSVGVGGDVVIEIVV